MTHPLPVQLEDFFFPVQEVRANSAHNPGKDEAAPNFEIAFEVSRLDGDQCRYAAHFSLECNQDKNPTSPYFVKLYAYASLKVLANLDDVAAMNLAHTVGFPILVGAARERLAEITARGPWGRMLLGAIPYISPSLPLSKSSEQATNPL